MGNLSTTLTASSQSEVCDGRAIPIVQMARMKLGVVSAGSYQAACVCVQNA
jgi:hypothetical protein